MNILYIHGYDSEFQRTNPKVIALSKLGTVYGVPDLNWGSETAQMSMQRIRVSVLTNDIDLIVGTSFGGWGARIAGELFGIPFVAINPLMNAEASLKSKGYDERIYETFHEYDNQDLQGCGLVMLAADDNVLSSDYTEEVLSAKYKVEMFPDGGHRFLCLEERLEHIVVFLHTTVANYGAENF